MSVPQDNKYPMEPPYEDEVVFFEGTVLRVIRAACSKIPRGSHAGPRSAPSVITPSTSEWCPGPASTTFATSATPRTPLPAGAAAA